MRSKIFFIMHLVHNSINIMHFLSRIHLRRGMFAYKTDAPRNKTNQFVNTYTSK